MQFKIDRCIELVPAVQSLQTDCRLSVVRGKVAHWLGVRQRAPLAEECPIYSEPQELTQVSVLKSRYLVAPVQAWLAGAQWKLLIVAFPVILAMADALCR